MFLDNLSANLLQLCSFYHLSCERGAERCAISSRYFGSIARGKTSPTILTLEKLCVGFNMTPNDLLIASAIQREFAYRQPLSVTQIRCYQYGSSLTGFPVCPRCECTDVRWNGNTRATVTAAGRPLTGASLTGQLRFFRKGDYCAGPSLTLRSPLSCFGW